MKKKIIFVNAKQNDIKRHYPKRSACCLGYKLRHFVTNQHTFYCKDLKYKGVE